MYRILIADDEGIMLESLKNIISSNYGNECEIHTAKTGRVVVEEAEKYPPDICFMDIQMPGLSGIQAIREIQKFNRSVVFVIITAPACISPHSDNNPSVPESFLPSDTGTYCPAHRQKLAQAL